jgi:hypothetical protein
MGNYLWNESLVRRLAVHLFEGKTYDEIALLFGLTRKAVSVGATRFRKELNVIKAELEMEAKAEANAIKLEKEYTTVSGAQTRIYAIDGRGEWCVHGAVLTAEGWYPARWDKYGDHENNEDFDLGVSRRVLWVWYNKGDHESFDSLRNAQEWVKIHGGCITKVDITAEEGTI